MQEKQSREAAGGKGVMPKSERRRRWKMKEKMKRKEGRERIGETRERIE